MRKTYIRELTQLASDWVVIQHMAGLQPYYNPRHVPAVVLDVEIAPDYVAFYHLGRYPGAYNTFNGPMWELDKELPL